ncbi:MAG: hypothetical protein GEV03_10415 [Streptosporangiales bacterium]|nr:hypothetical protein [Streptosporangiales bacterium]
MVAFSDLRDAQLGKLNEAAGAWRKLTNELDDLEERSKDEVTGPIRGSGWKGPAAKAASAELDRLDDEFALATLEVRNVATALDAAVGEFQGLQQELRRAIDEATDLHLKIRDDGAVELPPVAASERDDPGTAQARSRLAAQAQQLADRITGIVRRATDADGRYASALAEFAPVENLAEQPNAWHDAADDSRLAARLTGINQNAIPDPNAENFDPRRARAWWDGLSEERQELYKQLFPGRVGALDGLPAEDRDEANTLALRERIGELENKQGQTLSGFERRDLERSKALLCRLEASEGGAKELLLVGIDNEADGRALVAVGNPDTARHTAVVVPGVGTELDDMPGQIARAERIQAAADDLTADRRGDVAVVAWLGYDTPGVDLSALRSSFAEAGGRELDGFVDGLRAAQGGEHHHVTAVGHSYGSTVVGEAAKSGDGLAVDDIAVAGSPGMHVDHVRDLKIDPQHVWAGHAEGDAISGWAGSIPGIHNNEPSDEDFGANRYHVDTHGHSGYWDPNSESLRNQARIITGQYNRVTLDHGRPPS